MSLDCRQKLKLGSIYQVIVCKSFYFSAIVIADGLLDIYILKTCSE